MRVRAEESAIRAHLTASFIVVAAVLFYLLAALGNDVAPIQLVVRPTAAIAPADVHIELRVPRHPDNRVLRVYTHGDQFERVSAWDIPGHAAPYLFTVWWRALPAGEYVIYSEVVGASGVRGRARQHITIIGS